MTARLSSASGVAMTDLFISATAALLIVLAVAQQHVPQPLPIQSDFLAFCPSRAADADPQTPPVVMVQSSNQPESTPIEITRFEDLAQLPSSFGMTQKPYFTVAVVPNASGQVTGECFARVSSDFAKSHNAALNRLERQNPQPRAVFIVSLVIEGLADGG